MGLKPKGHDCQVADNYHVFMMPLDKIDQGHFYFMTAHLDVSQRIKGIKTEMLL